MVVLSRSPSGLPMATTSAPTATPPPSVAGTTTSGSFARVSVAVSIFGFAEAIVAVVFVPSAKVIEMRAAAGDDVVGGEHGAGVGDDHARAERAFRRGDQHHRRSDLLV